MASQSRCNYCHGDKYPGVLAEWRKTVLDQTAKAETALASAQAAVAKVTFTGEDDLTVKRLLDDAGHNIRLVKLGHGVHNVTYATAVLNVAVESAKKAEGMAKK